MKDRLGLLLLLLLALAGAASAEEATLEVALPDDVMLGLTYTSLFRIENNGYGETGEPISITVFYSLEKEGLAVAEGSFTKTVNSFSSASTGMLFFREMGNYTLCGWSNMSNTACKEVRVVNPLDVQCSASLGVSVQKALFESGERVEIRNSLDFGGGEAQPFTIQYWVEDDAGNVVKRPLNTSNLDPKSFTPAIDLAEQGFVARGRLIYVGCNNTSPFVDASAAFMVVNPAYLANQSNITNSTPVQNWSNATGPPANATNSTNVTLPPLNATGNSSANVSQNTSVNVSVPTGNSTVNATNASFEKGSILSFYTRMKNYNESINLYSTVLTRVGGTVIVRGDFGEQSLLVPGDPRNQQLSFNVRAVPGDNNYIIELREKGNLSDSRELTVSLAGAGKGSSGGGGSGAGANATAAKPKASPPPAAGKGLSTAANKSINTVVANLSARAQAGANLTQQPKAKEAWVEPAITEAAGTPPGLTVYEGVKAKSMRLAPVALAIAIGLVIAGLFARKGR